MFLPKAAELLADEVNLLFEDPMSAFLDDTAIGGIGDRLCAVRSSDLLKEARPPQASIGTVSVSLVSSAVCAAICGM